MILKRLFSFLPGSLRQVIRNYYYLNKLQKAQEEDEVEVGAIKQFISEGNVVFDIGANYGYYSKFLSMFCGPNGRVCSFEPIPDMFKALNNNVQKLNLHNVETFQLALSNAEGTAKMSVPEHDGGGSNYYEASLNNQSSNNSFEVKVEKLDKLFPDLNSLDFIKCDVEGHELQVLEGGIELLSRCKPMLMLEINGGFNKNNTQAMDIKEFMEKLDYQVYYLQNESLNLIREEGPGHNFFFIPREKISSVKIIDAQ